MAPGAEIITSLSLLGMAALGLLSVVPVDLRRGWQVVALYYPVVALGLLALYEAGMQVALPPESVPIRIDWAFVRPLVGFIVLAGICRWGLVIRASDRPANERKPETGYQLIGAMGSLVVCFGWFCSMWF